MSTVEITTDIMTVNSAEITAHDYTKASRIIVRTGLIAFLQEEHLPEFITLLAQMSDDDFARLKELSFKKSVQVGKSSALSDASFADDMSQLYVYMQGWCRVNFTKLAQLLGILQQKT